MVDVWAKVLLLFVIVVRFGITVIGEAGGRKYLFSHVCVDSGQRDMVVL